MSGGQPIHGHAIGSRRTPTYSSWMCMKTRCLDHKHKKFAFYGGRGITICARWLELRRGAGFANFLADMGERPPGCTLDRIDSNGNYEPKNCRWATRQQQTENARGTKHITLNGETLTQTQWSMKMFGNYGFVSRRLQKGWTMKEAILTPRMRGRNNERLVA